MKIIKFFIIWLITASCVESFDLETGSASNALVVDGLITNAVGPHQVILSRPDDFSSSTSAPEILVSGALLEIVDSSGEIEQLSETSLGKYETSSSFIGIPGEAYTLKITLENGDRYESTPEVMPPSTQLDSIIINFEEREALNENNVVLPITGMTLSTKSSITQENELIRLRYSSIYEISTNPELFKTIRGPEPRECSGYIFEGVLEQIGPCTCCICYVESNSTVTKLYNSGLFPQTETVINELDFIKNEPGTFQIRFFIEVQQLSLTPEAYRFWSSVAAQEANGSLFNQPPGKLISNIKSIDNPSETVLGYFNVSSIDVKSRFILPNEIPITIPVLVFNEDCRKFFNSDTEKPLFW